MSELTSEKKKENWFKSFSSVNKLFQDNDVEHVFIKLLIKPFTPMSDIDVLIPNRLEEIKALELLHEQGYKFFRSRLLGHPFKIMCKKEGTVTVDIYPDVIWIRKKVNYGHRVILKRRYMNVGGVEAYLPSPEDAFYIIATHAYSHLAIEYPELLNCISILRDYDVSWDYIYNISCDFGTLDAIYCFLKLISLEDPDVIPDRVIDKFSRNRLCKLIDRWIGKQQEIDFPLNIPTSIGCILSSFYYTSKIWNKVSVMETAYGFLSYYLTLFSKKIYGRA